MRRATVKPAEERAGGTSEALDIQDPQDIKIIDHLRGNGRVPLRDIAVDLKVSEAAVRKRILKLERDGFLRIVTMVNQSAVGRPFTAMVGVSVSRRSPASVAKDLGREKGISTILIKQTKPELLLRLTAGTLEELHRLMTDVISAVPGVKKLFPSVVTTIHKYDIRWAPPAVE